MSTQGDAKLVTANLAAAEERYSRCKSRVDGKRKQLAEWDDAHQSDKSGYVNPITAGQARYNIEKSLLIEDEQLPGFAADLVSCRMAARVPGYHPVELMAAVDHYRKCNGDDIRAAMAQYFFDSVDEVRAALDHYRHCRSDV